MIKKAIFWMVVLVSSYAAFILIQWAVCLLVDGEYCAHLAEWLTR